MKKVVLAVIALLCVAAGIYYFSHKNDDTKPALHSWIKNTGKIIHNIGQQILPAKDHSELPQSENPAAQDSTADTPKSVTHIPSVNWHYTPEHDAPVTQTADDKRMLPDLFRKQVAEPKTSLSGKLHLDEGDNFEGAEVGVEIPTKL